jgi:hypothetical protein
VYKKKKFLSLQVKSKPCDEGTEHSFILGSMVFMVTTAITNQTIYFVFIKWIEINSVHLKVFITQFYTQAYMKSHFIVIRCTALFLEVSLNAVVVWSVLWISMHFLRRTFCHDIRSWQYVLITCITTGSDDRSEQRSWQQFLVTGPEVGPNYRSWQQVPKNNLPKDPDNRSWLQVLWTAPNNRSW